MDGVRTGRRVGSIRGVHDRGSAGNRAIEDASLLQENAAAVATAAVLNEIDIIPFSIAILTMASMTHASFDDKEDYIGALI